jgi:nucleotide-binding universal stress UspA family protein
VIRIPRSFLDSLDDDLMRSFLYDSPVDSATPEEKAVLYLEERGQKVVHPIVAAIQADGIEPIVRYVDGDDPAAAIIETAQSVNAEIVLVGAPRRLVTEAAWRSVSGRGVVTSALPVRLVPGTRSEDTAEMPILES